MVMRRAMANILPAEVQWRGGKANLSQNFIRGLLAFERNRLEEMILNNPKVIEAYVDIAALREMYHRYVSRGTIDDAMTVWKAVTLGLWLHYTGLTPQANPTKGVDND